MHLSKSSPLSGLYNGRCVKILESIGTRGTDHACDLPCRSDPGTRMSARLARSSNQVKKEKARCGTLRPATCPSGLTDPVPAGPAEIGRRRSSMSIRQKHRVDHVDDPIGCVDVRLDHVRVVDADAVAGLELDALALQRFC